MTAHGRVAPMVAGLAVAAYVAAFRGYGLYDLADEGLLLAQAARADRLSQIVGGDRRPVCGSAIRR